MVEFRTGGLLVTLELRYDFQQWLVWIAVVLIKNFTIEWSGVSVFGQFKTLVENLVGPQNVKPRLQVLAVI